MNAARTLTVVFVPNVEWGGVMPTIPLAKALRSAGHRVLYVGPPSSAIFLDVEWGCIVRYIESAGFEFHPVARFLADSKWDLENLLRVMHAGLEEAIAEGERLLLEHGVDVALVDAFVWFNAIAAARAGVPTVLLKTNLRSTPNRYNPPCYSRRMPGGMLYRLEVLKEWSVHWIVWRLLIPLLPVPKLAKFRAFLHDIREKGGQARLQTVISDFFPEFALQEITLCPRSFDFRPMPNRLYVGAVDQSRIAAEEFNWPASQAGSRKIYCTLGTLTVHFVEQARMIVDKVLQAAQKLENISVVLQISHNEIRRSLQDRKLPVDTTVYEWVPQAAVLRHADMAIIAGGLGTIKECIMAGVPMLVVAPRHADKPGNAARVTYHGIGNRLDARSMTEGSLLLATNQLLGRLDECRHNMRPIQAEMCDQSGLDRFVKYIEQWG